MGGNTLSPALARGEVRETAVRLVDYSAAGNTAALVGTEDSGTAITARLQYLF